MPEIRILAVNTDGETELPRHLRAAMVDYPSAGLRFSSDSIEIVGWAIGREEPVSKILVVSEMDGEEIERHSMMAGRPDLLDRYAKFAQGSNVSFNFSVGMSRKGPNNLILRALFANGQIADFARIQAVTVCDLLLLVSFHEMIAGSEMKRTRALFTHLVLDTRHYDAGIYVARPEYTFNLEQPHSGYRIRFKQEIRGGAKPIFNLVPCITSPMNPSPQDCRAVASLCASLIKKLFIGKADYSLLLNGPEDFQYEIFKALAPGATQRIIDLSDDFTTWDYPGAAHFPEQLESLIQQSEKVLYANKHLSKKFPHSDSLVIGEGAEFSNYQKETPELSLAPLLPKPDGAIYVGYIGGLIGLRTDRQILHELFEHFPNFQFPFVGYCLEEDLLEFVQGYSNASFQSCVSFENLPAVLRSFDVAIIPHLDNEYTRGNDLLKVHDYLAAGVPVVATPSSGLEDFADLISLARSPREFCLKVEEAVANYDPKRIEAGIAFAQANSWETKIPQIARWLTRDDSPVAE